MKHFPISVAREGRCADVALPMGAKRRDFYSDFHFNKGPQAHEVAGREGDEDALETPVDDHLHKPAKIGHVDLIGAGPGDSVFGRFDEEIAPCDALSVNGRIFPWHPRSLRCGCQFGPVFNQTWAQIRHPFQPRLFQGRLLMQRVNPAAPVTVTESVSRTNQRI